METLQVRLMVLLALGTVGVMPSSSLTPPLGCGPPKAVKVRFNEIKVMGDGSDVVYHRATVTVSELQFAMNTSISLPSDSFVECAKAAARADLEAFVFTENCTGYQLNHRFFECQRGDLVVFVRADISAEKPAVVPFDRAPYVLKDNDNYAPYRQYMLSSLVEVDDDHPEFIRVEKFDGYEFDDNFINFIYLQNGDIIQTLGLHLDVDFCLTDGTYGLPIALNYAFYYAAWPSWPTLYFFQECGKTITFSDQYEFYSVVILSHPGFGCKYYPSGLPDECTIIFEADSAVIARYGFYFSETNSDDSGLIMTITSSNTNTGETMTENMYQSNTRQFTRLYNKFNISLQRQPSKRAIGFFLDFY